MRPAFREVSRRPVTMPARSAFTPSVALTPSDRSHALPDVADDAARAARPLDWVGMREIALPLRLTLEDGGVVQVPASVDVFVDLQRADARGIHMSRLYGQIQSDLAQEALTPARLRLLVLRCAASQGDLSSSARVALRYEHLIERAALASGLRGWKRYPIDIEASLERGHHRMRLGFSVEYSSTCPASAALSRQANAERFTEDFSTAHPLSTQVVRDWLASERGLAATPHAQRSRAKVTLELQFSFESWDTTEWIDRVEAALGTPVQTAVKREDEQAFARLNAEHLMFCEDAARRIAAAFADDPRVLRFDIEVAHFESLHPHDAVAMVSGKGGAG